MVGKPFAVGLLGLLIATAPVAAAAPGRRALHNTRTFLVAGVSGVAGYVTTPAGKTFVLVSLVNDARADYGAAEPVHAAIVNWVQANL